MHRTYYTHDTTVEPYQSDNFKLHPQNFALLQTLLALPHTLLLLNSNPSKFVSATPGSRRPLRLLVSLPLRLTSCLSASVQLSTMPSKFVAKAFVRDEVQRKIGKLRNEMLDTLEEAAPKLRSEPTAKLREMNATVQSLEKVP